MIRKEGSRYNVYNEAGTKRLGSHPTRELAEKQLEAIEISKHQHDSKSATKPKKKHSKQLGER